LGAILAGVGFFGACAAALSAATWEATVPPRDGDHFDHASFRLWIDDAAKSAAPSRPLRSLLILAPGWNGDGRSLATDPAWQKLARQLDAAIVAVHLRSNVREDDHAPRLYHRADLGSGAALVRALESFARDTRRPELAKLPWFAWGHSAGGQWAYGLANVYPERSAAFVAIKGGIYETPLNPQARAIPGLFVVGEMDAIQRAILITGLYERERRAGACWALAWDAGGGHELGGTLPLSRAYLREVASLRLPLAPGGPLRSIENAPAWIGERATYQKIEAQLLTAAQLPRTVWLPGPESGKHWQELGQGAP
jgi:pimeloyl-ACP methyl ester carboxylesterase